MRDHYAIRKDLHGDSSWYLELELEPEELAAIGHVTAQWAALEHLIWQHTQFLTKFIVSRLPKEANSESFRKRKRAWESLAREVFQDPSDDLSAILSIIERVGSLSNERHKLVHGLVRWSDTDKGRLNIHTNRNPAGIPWNVDVARIEETARKIAVLYYDLMAVHGPVKIEPFASRRKRDTPVRLDPHLPSQGPSHPKTEERKNPKRSSEP